MSILTNLPVTAICGTPVVVTVDKAQFVIDFGIVDAYWSDPLNWQEIEFYYVNDTGVSEVKKMSFGGNTYSLNLSPATYNGNMICKKITLKNPNNAILAFNRAQFSVASEFDFAVIGGYPPADVVEPFSLTLINTALDVLSNADYTVTRNGVSSGFFGMNYSNNAIPMASGKFYKEILFDVDSIFTPQIFLGIRLMNTAPTLFGPDAGSGLMGSADNQYQVLYKNNNGSPIILSQDGVLATVPVLTGLPVLVIGDRISFAIDFNSPTKDFYVAINGVWQNSADPVTGTGKVELNTVFPGLPSGLDLYFGFNSVSGHQWSIPLVQLYKPTGYVGV